MRATRVGLCIAAAAAAYASVPMGVGAAPPSVSDLTAPLQRIAFGSCNDQSFEQPLWPTIAAHKPDLWVWMGDNVWKLPLYRLWWMRTHASVVGL
jgi:alkaline phosphatase D